ncbi:MAG: flavin reductase family protein [Candidatus Omnitrophota bacterium]
MKVEIGKEKASRLINCGQVILVTSAYQDKRTITPCAWHMPISKDPALVAVALAKKHFSSQLIQQSKEFVINIPSWQILDKVMLCGSMSGRTCDKFSHAGLTAEKPHKLAVAVPIAESLGTLECGLRESKDAGDHYMFIGEVQYAQADDRFFINDIWDTETAQLIFHVGGKYFFPSQKTSEFKK